MSIWVWKQLVISVFIEFLVCLFLLHPSIIPLQVAMLLLKAGKVFTKWHTTKNPANVQQDIEVQMVKQQMYMNMK